MSNETYTYKDILLGVREECKKIKPELERLKELTSKEDNHIEDYFYWIYQWALTTKPEIICQTIKRKNKFKGYRPLDNIILLNQDNDFYFNKPAGLIVEPAHKTEFNKKSLELLSSEYANNMYTNYIHGTDGKYMHTTQITQSFLRSSIYKGLDGNLTFQYSPIRDELSLMHYPHIIDNEILGLIEHLHYRKDLFPEYIRNIIENQEDKEIIIDKINGLSTSAEYKIEEDKNKIYLKRKN